MSPYSIGFVLKAVVLMASGLYFFIRYYRKGPPVWLGVILITTGLFDFRFQLEMWLEGRSVSGSVHFLAVSLIHLMFVFANTLYHYFVLIFYLESSGFIKRYMYAALLVPLLVTLFRTEFYPELQFDYWFTAVWGAVFWAASLALVLRSVIREHQWETVILHLALGLILLTNGFILIVAHFQGQEFIELVNMTWFSIFLACCLLLLAWVNMRKVLVGMQRDAVVQKLDMSTALLHHTFKNAIGKIKINAWNIRNSLSKQDVLSRQQFEEIDGYVQNLFSTYDHMMRMMAKISQIVRNKLVVRPEPVDLAGLLDDAVEAAGLNANVRVIKQVEPMTVSLDRALMLECLINMIHNAADAMFGEGTITMTAGRKGRRVFISLSDSGTGMSEDQRSQIFEPFYSTKGRTGKNMGLGMYYVRKVVEAHKGKIAVDSELGEGTTITLQFKQTRKGLGWKK